MPISTLLCATTSIRSGPTLIEKYGDIPDIAIGQMFSVSSSGQLGIALQGKATPIVDDSELFVLQKARNESNEIISVNGVDSLVPKEVWMLPKHGIVIGLKR